MAMFAKRQSKKGQNLVVSGKRRDGVWTMESKLRPKARRSKTGDALVLDRENRRVRTLH